MIWKTDRCSGDDAACSRVAGCSYLERARRRQYTGAGVCIHVPLPPRHRGPARAEVEVNANDARLLAPPGSASTASCARCCTRAGARRPLGGVEEGGNMNVTLLKALLALVPTGLLFSGS